MSDEKQIEYLTVLQVAARYHIDSDTVIQLVRTGRLPAIRLGKRRTWRILDTGPELLAKLMIPNARELVDEHKWIRRCEVAAWLNIRQDQVYKWSQENKIPFLKLNKIHRLYSFAGVIKRVQARYAHCGPPKKNSLRPWVLAWMSERFAEYQKRNLVASIEIGQVVSLPTMEEWDAAIQEIAALPEPGRTEAWHAFLLNFIHKATHPGVRQIRHALGKNDGYIE